MRCFDCSLGEMRRKSGRGGIRSRGKEKGKRRVSELFSRKKKSPSLSPSLSLEREQFERSKETKKRGEGKRTGAKDFDR